MNSDETERLIRGIATPSEGKIILTQRRRGERAAPATTCGRSKRASPFGLRVNESLEFSPVSPFCFSPRMPWPPRRTQIVVEAGATEIFIGESVDYLVEIRNATKNPSPPDVSALHNDFDVSPNGDESRNQSSTFVVNGNVTRQEIISHVYRFRLDAEAYG